MRAFKCYLSILVFSLVCGCAGSGGNIGNQPQSRPAASQESAGKAESLSAGEKVSIETSQGKIEVEPSVVAPTDAQTDPDIEREKFYYDPWERVNRPVFIFNHYFYSYLLIPAADGYHFVVPAGVRDKVGNAFANIREPLNMLNNLLAGQVDDAGANLGRFMINSTLGVFGLFDPAANWLEIEEQRQTIAQTLWIHGVASGPYLVLPILGSNDGRGTFSLVTESFIHPIHQLMDPPESYQLRIFGAFDEISNQTDTYQEIYRQAEDPYIYFRNQYIQGQRRNELVQNRQRNDQDGKQNNEPKDKKTK